MALRPVSELGLIDLTDLASREDAGTASERPTKPPKTKTAAAPKRSSATVRRVGAKPAPRPKPARSAAKPSRAAGSGKTSESRSSTVNVSRQASAQPGPKRPGVAKVAIPALSGVIGIVGGILLTRTALHR